VLDERSDIFSVGIVLYELLAGRLPFQGKNAMDIYEAIQYREPLRLTRYNNEVSGSLQQIVNKALQKKLADRYQRIEDLLKDLKKERENLDSARSPKPVPRPRWPLVVAAVVILTLVATFYLLSQKKENSPPPIPIPPQEMALVPGGAFLMGGNDNNNERPVHRVEVKAFYMDKYEVTVAQPALAPLWGFIWRARRSGISSGKINFPFNSSALPRSRWFGRKLTMCLRRSKNPCPGLTPTAENMKSLLRR